MRKNTHVKEINKFIIMPKKFDDAIKNGGKVITKRLNDKQYIHIVYPKGGGAPIKGEVKNYKTLSRAHKISK